MSWLITILRTFAPNTAPAPVGDTEAVRELATLLPQAQSDEVRLTAAAAFLLARVVCSDRDVSPAEHEAVREALSTGWQVAPDDAHDVAGAAIVLNRAIGCTENFLVSREYRQHSSRAQRRSLVRYLFDVADVASRSPLQKRSEVRQIQSELHLER